MILILLIDGHYFQFRPAVPGPALLGIVFIHRLAFVIASRLHPAGGNSLLLQEEHHALGPLL